ncbi:MAG: hypothetical protein A4E58_01005 [Syntrophorhabdus sp. PtaB.Bin006]|nr:MAG: hypothetical protein A4E58_01005 [Syntrophorhabdus sp. PtaB.Bin006]
MEGTFEIGKLLLIDTFACGRKVFKIVIAPHSEGKAKWLIGSEIVDGDPVDNELVLVVCDGAVFDFQKIDRHGEKTGFALRTENGQIEIRYGRAFQKGSMREVERNFDMLDGSFNAALDLQIGELNNNPPIVVPVADTCCFDLPTGGLFYHVGAYVREVDRKNDDQ